MGLLRILISRKARNELRRQRFLNARAAFEDLNGTSFNKTVIATVAFNRPELIEWQIYLIRKHLAERCGYIVFDNSSNAGKREAIRKLCEREAVPYIGLPQNRFKNSESHGMALNWIVTNFLLKHRPTLFGFLDHDIFPVQPFSIAQKMTGKKAYGVRHQRKDSEGRWFFWPGFCFFTDEISVDRLDFRPTPEINMDTGGGNWPILKELPDEAVFATDCGLLQVKKGDHVHQTSFQSVDGGWLHVINGSGWNDVGQDRSLELLELLTKASGTDHPKVTFGKI